MRRSNFALRLQPSLLEELRKAAELEGLALNQLINVAVAEKVSALRTEEYFRERGRRGNRAGTLRILERAGRCRKRVLWIAASILAAHKLALFDGGKRVPATMSAIRGCGAVGRGNHEGH
jgi:hypothetical protein